VAKRPKFRAAAPSPADLTARIRRAEGQGRYQQALELARSLYKQDPTPPHRDLLQQMILGRARQLRGQGLLRDAQGTLESAASLDGGRAWVEQVAQELAACGAVARALELLRPFPDSPALPRVLGLAVDAAVGQGKAGRSLLPEHLHAHFDLVVQAFAQAEAGRDEEARTSLQGIGLQSPFLEWKVLLRGLLAFYQGDNLRALENWQRLNVDRLPARLAAPLRFTIDPAFRLAQPPATQTTLQQQADRLQNSGLIQPLRHIQSVLANENKLPQAFRLAEDLLPALRREAPHLLPRLASCFYWAVIASGRPEDVPRFQRVFGPPADDPRFNRLHALAFEHRAQLGEAHRAWQDFEKEVAQHPAAWPGDQANRVRALVWRHMGTNAASMPDKKEMDELPPFLRNHPDRPRPLNPTAEKCFERSLELAPDQLDTYKALLELYRRKKKPAEAVKVARRLLERFPNDAPALETLGDLLLDQDEAAEGLQLLQRALQANPLERRLRTKVSTAHLLNGRQFAEQGQFDQARAEYQAAMRLGEGRKDATVLCKWAACEFKAGQPERAEELIQQARTGAGAPQATGSRLAVAYAMLIEVIRLKLPRPIKNRFDKDFKEALAEPPTGAAAAAVADTAATHRLARVNYYGQKTHEKKVLAFLEEAIKADCTEPQLVQVCSALAALEATRLHLSCIRQGQRQFPHSPYFFVAEARYNIELGPHRCPIYPTQQLLQKAQELVNALPREERQQTVLDDIKRMQEMLAVLNPFARFSSMGPFDDPFDIFGFDDEDEDDEFFDDEDY
jgi:tetratricopeptide (TPR) repeat protein